MMTITRTHIRIAATVTVNLVIASVLAIGLAGLFAPAAQAEIPAEATGVLGQVEVLEIEPASAELAEPVQGRREPADTAVVVDTGVKVSVDGATAISARSIVRVGS